MHRGLGPGPQLFFWGGGSSGTMRVSSVCTMRGFKTIGRFCHLGCPQTAPPGGSETPHRRRFRRQCVVLVIMLLFWQLPIEHVLAATRTWDGGGIDLTCGGGVGDGNKVSCILNWSGDAVPGATDTVIFDSTSTKAATIDSLFSVQRLEIRSGYTDTITQSAVVRAGSFTQSGGTFSGGSSAIAVAGDFVQKAGTFQSTSGTFSLSGSLTLQGNPTFQHNNGTILLDGATDQTLTSSGTSLRNLTITNTGGGSSDDIIIGGGLFLSGALTINSGNLDLTTNSQPLVVERTITLANDSEATLTTNSAVTASGTILVNDSATLTVTGGTWTLNDDSDQSVDLDGQRLWNLTVNNTGGGTTDDVSIDGGGLFLSGALTVTLGNLDLTTNSQAMAVEKGITLADATQATLTTNSAVTASGTILVNDSATLTVTDGTWTMNDDGNQSIDVDGQALSGVTLLLTNSATATVFGGLLDVNGNITVTTGTLAVSGSTLDLEGNLTTANNSAAGFSASGTLTVAGNITRGAASTFSLTGSTLTLDGTNQTIVGALTYHNLTKTVSSADTLTFPAGSTGSVVGTLTLQGAANQLLSLRSSVDGTRWIINPAGTISATYLNVKDSLNAAVAAISCTNCTNALNNVNWSFPAASSSSGGGAGGRAVLRRLRGAVAEAAGTTVTSRPVQGASASENVVPLSNLQRARQQPSENAVTALPRRVEHLLDRLKKPAAPAQEDADGTVDEVDELFRLSVCKRIERRFEDAVDGVPLSVIRRLQRRGISCQQ